MSGLAIPESGMPIINPKSDLATFYENNQTLATADIAQSDFKPGGKRNHEYTSQVFPGASIRSFGPTGDHEALAEYYRTHIGANEFKSNTEEAKRNNPRAALWLQQPFLNRGPSGGKEKPDMPEGLLTAPLLATARDAMFLGSPRGLIFLAKNVGYQLSNPRVENLTKQGTRIFNPAAIIAAPVGNMVGFHAMRHKLGPFNQRDATYEKIVEALNDEQGITIKPSPIPIKPKNQNRLINLGMERGFLGWNMNNQLENVVDYGNHSLNTQGTSITFHQASPAQIGNMPWLTLSGLGGPNSFLGIGATTLKQSSVTKYNPKMMYHWHSYKKPYWKFEASNVYFGGEASVAAKSEQDSVDSRFNVDQAKPKADQTWVAEKPLHWNHVKVKNEDGIEVVAKSKKLFDEDWKPYWKGQAAAGSYVGNSDKNTTYKTPLGDGEDDGTFPTNITPTDTKPEGSIDVNYRGMLNDIASSEAIENKLPPKGAGRGVTKLGIAAYKAFTYGDIREADDTNDRPYNFIKETDATKGRYTSDYKTTNIQARLGLGNYGRWDKSQPENDAFVNNDTFADLITFKLAGIQFRAIFDGDISDNHSFSWTAQSYVGRTSPTYTFDSAERSFTIKVQIPSFTADETRKNYEKVQNLLRACSPTFSEEGIPTAPLQNITLGDYWSAVPCIIESVNNTVSTADWDIGLGEDRQTVGAEVPKHFTLDISGKFILNADDSIISSTGRFFGSAIVG